jgi:glycosyltransferase involved in cell wall biosynthesis
MAAIDVLLPVRNGAAFLEDALESIRAQTWRDWRLLILDHGSSDASPEISQRYAELDRRIEVHTLPNAIGLAGLLNAGLDLCDARYVMRHDSDDIALPNRMQATMEAFEANPDCVVIGGEHFMMDASGRDLAYFRRPISRVDVGIASLFYMPLTHPTLSINLAEFKRLGAAYGRDFLRAVPADQSLEVTDYAEDYLLFGQLAILGLCMNIKQPLIRYRIHANAVSVTKIENQLNACLAISNFLANSFSKLNNLPAFDPRPFTNHSGILLDHSRPDLETEYHRMAAALRQGFGSSASLERELAFRWVLATSNPFERIARYAKFELRHGGSKNERGLLSRWMKRRIKQRYPDSRLLRFVSDLKR